MSAVADNYDPGLQHPAPTNIGTGYVGGGSGSGSGLVPYTGADPNSDGVTPTDQDADAVAVKPGGTIWTWDKVNHVWT
jgi:hypothetical protein